MTFCFQSSGRTPAALLLVLVLTGCTGETEPVEDGEEETLARTEFTQRIENFFEYTPLRSGDPSAFLIHLTDLADGTPVAQAEVELSVYRLGTDDQVASTTAQIGRVTGIYVAEVLVPVPGVYDIEFRVRNERLDERMLLTGFEVEDGQ
jgi:hypothetical protein